MCCARAWQGILPCRSRAAVTQGVFNSTHSVYLPTAAATVDDSLSEHMLVVSSLFAGAAQCWSRDSSSSSAASQSSGTPSQLCNKQQLRLAASHPALSSDSRSRSPDERERRRARKRAIERERVSRSRLPQRPLSVTGQRVDNESANGLARALPHAA
jgi:hypothetical protein